MKKSGNWCFTCARSPTTIKARLLDKPPTGCGDAFAPCSNNTGRADQGHSDNCLAGWPLGQKKSLQTIIDSSAKNFTTIFVSAGKRGLEIELSERDLSAVTDAQFVDISKR